MCETAQHQKLSHSFEAELIFWAEQKLYFS